jgi:outer membrane protein TolC
VAASSARPSIPAGLGARLIPWLLLPLLAGCFPDWLKSWRRDGGHHHSHAGGAALVGQYYQDAVGGDAIYAPGTDIDPASVPAPRLADNPEAPEGVWKMTLHEAIRLALENHDVLVRNQGTSAPGENGPNLGFGTIGRTIYDPYVVEQEIERQLSRFDARWETNLAWSNLDLPASGVDAILDGRRDEFQGQTVLRKAFGAGGEASIGFNTDYRFFRNRVGDPSFNLTNPQYGTQMTFGFRQPLGGPDQNGRFRGFGVAYNLVPVVIARINADQELHQFRENVMIMLRDVEDAYWNLYGSQEQLAAIDQGIAHSREYLRVLLEEQKAGRGNAAQLAEANVQIDSLRGLRVSALYARRGTDGIRFDGLLFAEATLRGLIGVPLTDGKRIEAVDMPTIAPTVPKWEAVLTDAFSRRPAVLLHRLNVLEQQQRLIEARGRLRPQVDVGGQWRVNGLGQMLDDSVDLLTDNLFADWQLDVRLIVPLGYRLEVAENERALGQVASARARLRQAQQEAIFTLAERYRELNAAQLQYRIALDRLRSNRERYQQNLELLNSQEERSVINLRLVQAIDGLREATIDEIDARVQYNVELARLEHEKGTLLEYDNVHFHEGPWPAAAYPQAESQQRDRDRAIRYELPGQTQPVVPPPYQPHDESPAAHDHGHSHTDAPASAGSPTAPATGVIQTSAERLPPAEVPLDLSLAPADPR